MKKKILFVDDDRATQNIMKQYANMHDVNFTSCFSPSSAIAMMEVETYDVVFIDQRLPDMKGTDLLYMLSEKYPQTNFYLTTNFPKEALFEDLKNLNIKGFIDKVDLVDKFIEAIK